MIWTSLEKDLPPVTVTVASQADLLLDLSARITAKTGFAVATLNLDHVVKLQKDAAFRKAYTAQTHVTADGRPIVWLSNYVNDDVALVTGSDLVQPLMERCAALGAPVAFFGSSDAVLAAAAKSLKARFGALNIVASIAPPMGFDPGSAAADDMIDALKQSGAAVCFLALGAPKQEIFAARAYAAAPDMGFVSIGAGLDFIAGTQTRAPKIVRAFAAEWLWRLLRNPGRLAARYGACIAVLPGLLKRAHHIKRTGGSAQDNQR